MDSEKGTEKEARAQGLLVGAACIGCSPHNENDCRHCEGPETKGCTPRSPTPRDRTAEKRAMFEAAAKAGPVVVRLDPRKPGVEIPGVGASIAGVPSISVGFNASCAETGAPTTDGHGAAQTFISKAPRIEVGAKMQLNSGGPEMEIASIENDQAVCRWPVGAGFETAAFPVASLTPLPTIARIFVPWAAIWAIEGRRDDACGIFEESIPLEQITATFAHVFVLQDRVRTLTTVVAEALKIYNAGSGKGAWREWRNMAEGIMRPPAPRPPPGRPGLQVVPAQVEQH
jgi:uncharacterized protein YodC (DUF2158 family)